MKQIIKVLGQKWTYDIFFNLTKIKRYSEIKRELTGITPNVLSDRLKKLVKVRLVKKEIITNVCPIICRYSMTEFGIDVKKRLIKKN